MSTSLALRGAANTAELAHQDLTPPRLAGASGGTAAAKPRLDLASRRSEALDFLSRELAARSGSPNLIAISLPAPLAAPEVLLGIAGQPYGLVWDPADRGTDADPDFAEAIAGLGAAWHLDLEGPDRFGLLRHETDALWNRLESVGHPDVLETAGTAPAPRLYGGFAFAVGAAAEPPWQGFGDGGFTLPRMLYRRGSESAVLTVSVEGQQLRDTTAREALVAEAETALLELALGELQTTEEPIPGSLVEPARQRWTDQIEAIRDAIAAGKVEKIVAAQRARVELEAALEVPAVLRRLARGLRASTRFAFCREGGVFLGATPERLIARRGQRIATDALAGSIDPGAEHAAQLLASGKDQREHRLVVDAIVRRLEPLCSHLDVAHEPRVRELREVLHLHTPIAGELREPRHILDLVETLHPTPAVGGVPTAEALHWIAEHEDDARGWYAAPVGWLDAHGDGEFAVALRSAVLRGHDAHLYAGAGIVRDSDPDLEWVETRLKRQALLRALGAGT